MGTLRQIILPVDDVSSAVAHYGEALGLPVRFQDGERWAVLDAGGIALALAGAGEQPAGDRAALGVKVTDVDVAVNDIVRAGGAVLDPPHDGEHERRAACRDRFGTVLALYEPRSK
jgi:predicted enzyme related to lactoylglutathione lyase